MSGLTHFNRMSFKQGFKNMIKHISDQAWMDFLSLCVQLKSIEEFNEFFNFFLTHEEKQTLASRYIVVKTLMHGKMTQREIAEKYKVSIAQITRGSNALKGITASLKKFLEKNLNGTLKG